MRRERGVSRTGWLSHTLMVYEQVTSVINIVLWSVVCVSGVVSRRGRARSSLVAIP